MNKRNNFHDYFNNNDTNIGNAHDNNINKNK